MGREEGREVLGFLLNKLVLVDVDKADDDGSLLEALCDVELTTDANELAW